MVFQRSFPIAPPTSSPSAQQTPPDPPPRQRSPRPARAVRLGHGGRTGGGGGGGGGEGGRKRREDTGTNTGVDLPSPRPAPPALSPLPRGALPAAPPRRVRLPPGAPPAPLRRYRPVMPRGLSPPPPALPCAPPGSPSGSGVPPDPTHPRSCPGAPQLPRCGSTAGGAAAGKVPAEPRAGLGSRGWAGVTGTGSPPFHSHSPQCSPPHWAGCWAEGEQWHRSPPPTYPPRGSQSAGGLLAKPSARWKAGAGWGEAAARSPAHRVTPMPTGASLQPVRDLTQTPAFSAQSSGTGTGCCGPVCHQPPRRHPSPA